MSTIECSTLGVGSRRADCDAEVFYTLGRSLLGTLIGPHCRARVNRLARCAEFSCSVLKVQLDDLTPNIGLHWYFFAEMFAVFRPLWHFVFAALSAAAVVPVAIRLPHRPLAVAAIQSCATALLQPYPSVTDVAQYLVSNCPGILRRDPSTLPGVLHRVPSTPPVRLHS